MSYIVKKLLDKPLQGTGSGVPVSISGKVSQRSTLGDILICHAIPWGFASCAATLLQNFKMSSWWAHATQTEVNEFVAWLIHPDSDPIPENGYCCSEVYFLLATHQMNNMVHLTEHPCCREIDRFTNKAHGGNTMVLYRLSYHKDFKK